MGLSNSSVGKESTCNAGDPSPMPGSGRSAGEGVGYPVQWDSFVAQLVRNSPAKWETLVWFPGEEDLLEKGEATHSSIWPREFQGLYSPWGHKESDTTEPLSLSIKVCSTVLVRFLFHIYENSDTLKHSGQCTSYEYPISMCTYSKNNYNN